MSYLKVLHCTLCLRQGAFNLSNKSVLLKIGNKSPTQHLINISTSSYLNNNLPLTTQTSTPKKKSKNVPEDNRVWRETPTNDIKNNLTQYCMMLSKFRLTSLVVMTSMAGYALAPAPFEFTTFAVCSVGTGLVSAAANSINQYHEMPFDAQMSRTKNRVLVKGLLEPTHAIGFAAITSMTGLGLLYFGVNPLTAALGAGNLVLYTSIYTPMKRISILNTWIGSVVFFVKLYSKSVSAKVHLAAPASLPPTAIYYGTLADTDSKYNNTKNIIKEYAIIFYFLVGAIPPLMGWAGCTGDLSVGALALSALLFAWQFPHFNALSWNLRPDYSRAGYRMMAVTDPGLCRRVALRHTGLITAACLATPYLDVTNMWFAVESLPLNIYFMYLAWRFYKESDSGSSRRLFRFSLIHLPALMFLMLVNKKYWASSDSQEQKDTFKQDIKHPESKRITVLPRGPVVAAQDSTDTDSVQI